MHVSSECVSGYMVFGPSQILSTPKTIIRAADIAIKTMRIVDSVFNVEAFDPNDYPDYPQLTDCTVLAELKEWAESSEIKRDEDIERFVREFILFWNQGGCEDTVTRENPVVDGQVIMFAGSVDYGDGEMPIGAGYEYLKFSELLGLWDIFGIV